MEKNMASGGEHLISSGKEEPKEPSKPSYGIFYIFGTLFFFIILLKSFSPTIAPSSLTTTAPSQPTQRAAVFQASGPSHEPLLIILHGGSYNFTYQSVETFKGGLSLGSLNTFTANFIDGTTTGDINNADTIIIVGNVNLSVKDIYRNDQFQAKILNNWDGLTAQFKYVRSERGPPSTAPPRRVKIIIIGKIDNIDMGDSYHDSTRSIEILDLNPTEEEVRHYEDLRQQYERKVEQEFRRREYEHVRRPVEPVRRGSVHR
jgi:hypothetical protein